ncbi:MAG: DUF5615 family PIN-like protein [Bacteroidota bacterium]
MKLLLDENIPKPVAKLFSPEFEVSHVHDMEWSGKKNGALISAMLDNGFERLVTVDRNLEFQQNLDKYPIKLIVLVTYSNQLRYLESKVDFIEDQLRAWSDEGLLKIDLRSS